MRSILLYIAAFLLAFLAITSASSCVSTAGRRPTALAPEVPDGISQQRIADSVPLAADTVRRPSLPQTLRVDSAMVALADSALAAIDSLPVDSMLPEALASDSLPIWRGKSARRPGSKIVRDKVDLDAQVVFSSKDSLVMLRTDSAMMYGGGHVDYGDLKLEAENIEMDLNNSTVFAIGTTDSVGDVVGSPIFTEGGTDYEAKTMEYNFKTRKGFITNVVTQQGEGYLIAGKTKKEDDDSYNMVDGKYTTCDDHECPHFYFQVTKGKMRPGKNIVMGPTYMVLAGLPLPIAVPFGFFPFTDDYASGVIIPTFGDDYNRGFYLSNGGYYLAINDNIDLALTGELYTKGSWGLRAQSSYMKRYKFNGSFNLSYLKTIYGEKGSPDYSAQTNFQVLWTHTQDAKANPNMSLSASVNFATSGYLRNELSSYYSNAFTENTKSSTVNMTYRFPQSKWSVSTTFNLSQRTQDSTLTVSFPNVTLTMSQVYPFKRKKAVGSEKWYEKIRMSYSGTLQNSLTSKQNVFFKKSLIRDWRNAMRHSVPISATFNVFKYVNITPQVSLTDRMYTRKVRRHWNEVSGVEVMDTAYSFYNVWDFQASVSVDTKLYGFYQPLPFLGDKVKMIRHVLTPSITFSGAPDFASPFFGYYGRYNRPTSDGRQQQVIYSMFPNSLYGVPGQGKTGSIGLSLSNNLEMKVKSKNDSIGEKKISLIENLTLSQSYNMAADSLNFSDLSTSILLRLTKGFNLNLGATWDVYTYALNSAGNPVRVNKLRIACGKGYGRLRSTGTSFSYTLNNDTFKKLFGKDKDKNKDKDKPKTDAEKEREASSTDGFEGPDLQRQQPQEQAAEVTDGGYMKWTVPWSISFNYSISYGYGAFNKKKMEYDARLTQNLSFSGNIRPTKNWNFSFSASYNFDTGRIAYMNCNISRDLHCFTMTASFVPLGPYKSYNFHIAVKSSLLSDLKYDKRSSLSNGIQWY